MTAARLNSGADYAWSMQGACNCGHLAQTLTGLTSAEIHARGLEKPGDWRDHIEDWCTTSLYPIDQVIRLMLDAGLSLDDVANIERLGDQAVRAAMPRDLGPLDYKNRAHVRAYFETWAALLEDELARWDTAAA